MLRLRTQGGFANRLRAIISGVLWAQDLGVRLGIYWPVEPGHMPCALWELFLETSIPELEEVHASYLNGAVAVQTVEAARKEIEAGGRYLESYSEFHPECSRARGLQILQGLKFRPEIMELADSHWQSVGGGKGWIGVHYRGTDHVKCMKVCTPIIVLEKIKDCLEVYEQQKFWVATDDHSVGKFILDTYPSSVVMPIVVKSRNHKEGQILAIVDWLCLSRCAVIYGSAGSTFSEWAAYYGGATYVPLAGRKAIS